VVGLSSRRRIHISASLSFHNLSLLPMTVSRLSTISIVGISTLILLTSCVSLRPDLGEGHIESQQGFVERFLSPNLADDDWKNSYDVTYLLNRGNAATFLLAEDIDLGSRDYLGKRVRITGLVHTVDGEELMKVESAVVLLDVPSDEVSTEKDGNEPVEGDVPEGDSGLPDSPETSNQGNYAAVAERIKSFLFNDKTVTRFEFVEPNFVYVYYVDPDGSEARRELLTYRVDESGKVETEQVGHFKPGQTRDWELLSGDNPAAGRETYVITVAEDKVKNATTIQEGFRDFESKPLRFRMQYPANWYYARSGNGYAFSDGPLDENAAILTLKIVAEPSDNGVIPRYLGAAALPNGTLSVSYQGSNGTIYDLVGPAIYQDVMEKMIQTLEVTE
jgi:hypothetical protein